MLSGFHWRNVLGQVQVQALVQVVGLIWLVGVRGLAAGCLGIPCSLVVSPGRRRTAPQSLGWARVCGTEKSGVWVLKGSARTKACLRTQTMLRSSGNAGQVMRQPGPRQGTIVCGHTRVGMATS